MQELSLNVYSGLHYRPTNSVDLLFKIQVQEDLYHRVIIEDSRGLPIRYSTLQPYSILELQNVIHTAYREWYKGGYLHFKFYRNYPTFWFDLWKIVQREDPIFLVWYLPEVVEEETQKVEASCSLKQWQGIHQH